MAEARFGTSGFNILTGPRYSNLDLGLFREFRLTERVGVQFRAEAFNFTNTPHFNAPGTNRSSMTIEPGCANARTGAGCTIRSLGGYTEITSTRGTGREGIDQKQFRFGLRVSF